MEDFHVIMGSTYHPAEEGKLEPIRTRSKEMVDKAVAWEKSTAPAGYDKNAVSATLKKLVTGAKEIDRMVKAKATDQALKTKLSSLHDVFHEIMEKCRKTRTSTLIIYEKSYLRSSLFLLLYNDMPVTTQPILQNDAVVKTKADSLLDDVDDGHAIAMGKMGRLNRTQQEVSRLIDSIGKLPAKAREAAAPYKAKLGKSAGRIKDCRCIT